MPFFEDKTVNEMRVKDYDAAYRVIQRTPGDTAFVEMESRVMYNLNVWNCHSNNLRFNLLAL